MKYIKDLMLKSKSNKGNVGDVFTISEFSNLVNCRNITDEDGTGVFMIDGVEILHSIIPSLFVDEDFYNFCLNYTKTLDEKKRCFLEGGVEIVEMFEKTEFHQHTFTLTLDQMSKLGLTVSWYNK